MSANESITVLAFGAAASALGWSRRELPAARASRLAELIALLEAECPRMTEARGRLHFAVNERLASPDRELRPGDEVAIIPPVSGGDAEDEQTAFMTIATDLATHPIDVAAMQAEVADRRAGAVAVFLGVVRAETNPHDGRELAALEYTAYESMARSDLRRIAQAAVEQHELTAVRLVHRLGRLAIGEASVAVVVSSTHRAAAFAACRAIIEEVKISTPIFKREIWDDGESTWINDV